MFSLCLEYRYDGEIKFHICVPSRPQFGLLVSEPTIIRTFPWTLLAYFKKNFEPYRHDDERNFSLFLKCNQDKTVQNWSIFAKAEITLFHPTDPKKNCVRSKSFIENCLIL